MNWTWPPVVIMSRRGETRATADRTRVASHDHTAGRDRTASQDRIAIRTAIRTAIPIRIASRIRTADRTTAGRIVAVTPTLPLLAPILAATKHSFG